jgi:hypothetical protein
VGEVYSRQLKVESVEELGRAGGESGRSCGLGAQQCCARTESAADGLGMGGAGSKPAPF